MGRLLFALSLCLCIPLVPLFSAIVLYTPDTEVSLTVTNFQQNQKRIHSGKLPLCEISLLAKHSGSGRLLVSSGPLSNGAELISYHLAFETEEGLQRVRDKGFVYTTSPDRLESIAIAKLWAEFSNPIFSIPEGYVGNIYLNLILEK